MMDYSEALILISQARRKAHDACLGKDWEQALDEAISLEKAAIALKWAIGRNILDLD